MEVVSVSVSKPRVVTIGDKEISTGIFKQPANGRVMVRRLNLKGDTQADLRVHGGENMAVYAYPLEHYALWEKELGRADLPHGQFGENSQRLAKSPRRQEPKSELPRGAQLALHF